MALALVVRIKQEQGPDLSQVFMGNLDKDTERRHYLNEPFTARYIRLNPKHFHQAIALRAALLGCPHEGECGQRFFRVSPETSCGEYSNLVSRFLVW